MATSARTFPPKGTGLGTKQALRHRISVLSPSATTTHLFADLRLKPEEARRLGRSSHRRLKRLLQRTQLKSPVGASAGALADCRPERLLSVSPAAIRRAFRELSPRFDCRSKRAYFQRFYRSKRASRGPRRSKRAPQSPLSRRRHCCKCRATLVARAEPLCTTVTDTASASLAWAKPTPRTRSLEPHARTATGQSDSARGFARAHVGPDPACLALSTSREQSPVMFSRPDQHPSADASDLVLFDASDEEPFDDSMSLAASETEGWVGESDDPAPLHPLEPIEHGQGMDAELFRILSKAVEELDLEWAPPEEPSRSRLDEWFLPGQAPRQRSAPFFPEVHQELTKSWRAPYSARLHTTHRSALTAVDGSELKGYEHLPPLDEADYLHPGWKSLHLSGPSRPLHTMAIFQVFQAKLLRSLDESGVDEPAFRDLRSATDLALRATKATAQAIGRSMASLVVLERHLWLNLTEIKDLDKTAFLDAPVSPSGLFGPAVDGFTERFTAAQKSSQAMRHFLPKRSSSASAVSRPRPAPAQQNKPATSTAQAAAPKEHRQRSRPPKRPPLPRRQGPRPKIVLDPATPKTS
ncbi:hypothetical protein DPX16_15550 [Anabarilius grahami]|uniref:Uncharacterized protein n=1 Tax=Anabarilius grahami TaxID=495550 RepID=A0A3N0YJB8_ANAGA|nr:hypothetical protein DPX16_15550 [Anabarilius grahami]